MLFISKKWKKIWKKKVYRYILLFIDWQSIKFYIILLMFDTSSKIIKFNGIFTIFNDFKLTVFNGLSNFNEILWNLTDYQSINKITYL
jgi:hypothetical protein